MIGKPARATNPTEPFIASPKASLETVNEGIVARVFKRRSHGAFFTERLLAVIESVDPLESNLADIAQA